MGQLEGLIGWVHVDDVLVDLPRTKVTAKIAAKQFINVFYKVVLCH